MKIRTRFSPSPTGHIHLGNVRTALFSALYAAKHNGVFILRIEDTDTARSQEKYVDSLQDDLQWLGINWQEGPGKDGKMGPYWQSQRQAIYEKYYQILAEKNLLYPCFCTDQELLIMRKQQLAQGKPPRYAGTCLHLTTEEINEKISKGMKPALRFIVPKNIIENFEDVVKGKQTFKTNDIGDFIIRRADGSSSFLFCNAIDDALMQVSHVLRGEDHLTNTPRQILLLQALNLPIPKYGHISLIVGSDGAPLSKRHGSFNLSQLRDDGYLPLAIMNYLARLGHQCENAELLNFDHLANHFSLKKLSRSSSFFDIAQLLYWQKMAVQNLDHASLWHWLGTDITSQIPEKMHELFAEIIKNNIEFPKDALFWAKIFFHDTIKINEEELRYIRDAGEQYFVEAELAIDKYGMDLSAIMAEMNKLLGVSGKKLFMPFRVALTGKTFGPELVNVIKILGVDKIKKRLGHALKLAN